MRTSSPFRFHHWRAIANLLLLLSLGPFAAAQGQNTSAKPQKPAAQEKPLAKSQPQEPEGEEREKKDTARKRIEWFYQQCAFPLGFIPAGVRLQALQELDRMLEREGKLVRQPDGSVQQFIQPVTTMWTPIGPQPTVGTFFGNTSGRVTALAVDPTNPNIVYVGGAQGGVWKSTDGGTNWTPKTDNQASLAIGSIAIDPNSCSPAPCKTIYVSTGEENFGSDFPVNFASPSYYGAGILRSTDGGNTWTQLGAGTFFNAGGGPISARSSGARIGSVAISPNGQILLAAVEGEGSVASGIYRSIDGGVSWTLAQGGAPGTEVVFDPTNITIAYAALGGIFGSAANGVYKSTDGGATWNRVTDTGGVLPTGVATGRTSLAIAPSTTGATARLYASIQNPDPFNFGTLLGFFTSADGGTSWTRLFFTPDYCRFQCWYDNVVGVHPTDPQTVFAGGSARRFRNRRLPDSVDGWGKLLVGGRCRRQCCEAPRRPSRPGLFQARLRLPDTVRGQ